MIDILVLATADDTGRVGGLVDALMSAGGVAGRFRARLIVAAPDDPAVWNEVVIASEQCPCVIYCWSSHTTTPEMKSLRALARAVFADHRAVSVELDERTRPADLKQCITYPLYGWRGRPRCWHTFIFGNHFVTQIAAGAQEMVIGRDPQPPSAYTHMVRKRAWAAACAAVLAISALIGALDGVFGMAERLASAKWRHPEIGAAFDAALASARPCDAVRGFVTAHPGSAWATDAAERLSACTTRPVTDTVRFTQTLAVFGETRIDAERDAIAVCEGRAKLTGATLQSVELESFEAGGRSTARCELDEPRLQYVETMGGSGK